MYTCQIPKADLRSTANGLRCGPHSLGTVVSKDIQPVLVRLNATLDVEDAPLAVVTPAVSKIGCTLGMPHRRVSCIYPDRVCVLEHDICTLHVRRKVVILHSV